MSLRFHFGDSANRVSPTPSSTHSAAAPTANPNDIIVAPPPSLLPMALGLSSPEDNLSPEELERELNNERKVTRAHSHETRNIATTVSSGVLCLVNVLGSVTDPEMRKNFEEVIAIINTSINDTIKMTTEYLDSQKAIESNKTDASPTLQTHMQETKSDLKTIVADYHSSLSPQVETRQLELKRSREVLKRQLDKEKRHSRSLSQDSWSVVNKVSADMSKLADLAKRVASEETKEQLESLIEMISASLEDASGMLSHYLSADDQAEVKYVTAPFDLHAYMLKTKYKLQALVQGQVELKLDIPEENLWVVSSRDVLNRIFNNLVSNSVKHFKGFGNKSLITLAVEKKNEAQGSYKLVLSVKDNGKGMSQTLCEQLFLHREKEFVQANDGKDALPNTSGYGSNVVLDAVKYLNGQIWVKSTEWKGDENAEHGTTIFIEAEFKKASLQEIEEAKKKAAVNNVSPAHSSTPKRNIGSSSRAFVEQSPMNLPGSIESASIESGSIESASIVSDAALEPEFQPQPFDVILMDINMPVMGGLDATRLIRQFEVTNGLKPCRIIGLSGNVAESDRQEGINAGMNDYLGKPYTQDKLEQTIGVVGPAPLRVLIVDDSNVNAKLLARIVKNLLKHKAFTAGNGLIALDNYKRNNLTKSQASSHAVADDVIDPLSRPVANIPASTATQSLTAVIPDVPTNSAQPMTPVFSISKTKVGTLFNQMTSQPGLGNSGDDSSIPLVPQLARVPSDTNRTPEPVNQGSGSEDKQEDASNGKEDENKTNGRGICCVIM